MAYFFDIYCVLLQTIYCKAVCGTNPMKQNVEVGGTMHALDGFMDYFLH